MKILQLKSLHCDSVALQIRLDFETFSETLKIPLIARRRKKNPVKIVKRTVVMQLFYL